MNTKRTALIVLAAAFIVTVTITVGTIVSKNRAQDNETSTAASNIPQPPTLPPTQSANTAQVIPIRETPKPLARPANPASTPQASLNQKAAPNDTVRHIKQNPSPPAWKPPPPDQGPRITAVMAQDGTKAVLVDFNEIVHVRGEIRLQTSGGLTAPAADEVTLRLNNMDYQATVTPGGSTTLRFPAGPSIKGTVHIQGITLAPGAAVRDEEGNDAHIRPETSVPWTPGTLEPPVPDDWSEATYVSENFTPSIPNQEKSPNILSITAQTATYNKPNSPDQTTLPMWKIELDIPFQLNIQGINSDHRPVASTTKTLYYNKLPSSVQVKDTNDASTQNMWKKLTITLPDKDHFPTPQYPTHADCTWEISKSSSVDQIRLRTIDAVDPQKLTDKERRNWYQFFNNHGYETECNSFWSEPITPGNAEKRNEQYSSCVEKLNSQPQDDIEQITLNQETLELVKRPYLTLTLVEKHVLREKLGSNCERYYPQLYYGRWVPMPEDN